MRVVLFDGTTEGRTLSRKLAELGAEVTVCVATGYGQEAQGEFANVIVRTGRLETDSMVELLRSADLCVDATHPYAVQATVNIRTAAEQVGTPYHRLLRRASPLPEGSVTAVDISEAVAWLAKREGNILLTKGARLYPRVLPSKESLDACEAAGIPRRNVVAMQGPFSKELNLALLRQFSIRYLVTKDGGDAGGFAEKAAAAAAGDAVLY